MASKSEKIDEILIDVFEGEIEMAFKLALQLFQQGFPEKYRAVIAISSQYQQLRKKEVEGTFTNEDNTKKNSLIKRFIEQVGDVRKDISALEKIRKENLELLKKVETYKAELNSVRNDYERFREKVEQSILGLNEDEENEEEVGRRYRGKDINIVYKLLIIRKGKSEKRIGGWWFIVFHENNLSEVLYDISNLNLESNEEFTEKLKRHPIITLKWGDDKGWSYKTILEIEELDWSLNFGETINGQPVSFMVADEDGDLGITIFTTIEVPIQQY